jgi:hypothetical protein
MHLNNGEFYLNEQGIQFLEKQQRTLKFGIPLTVILAFLITAGGIYRLGLNLTTIVLLISANIINYLLNYRFNYIRRKKLLSQLVIKVTVDFGKIKLKLFNEEEYNVEQTDIVSDDPRVLFSEYTRLKERWSIKLDSEKEAWLIPVFFNNFQIV